MATAHSLSNLKKGRVPVLLPDMGGKLYAWVGSLGDTAPDPKIDFSYVKIRFLGTGPCRLMKSYQRILQEQYSEFLGKLLRIEENKSVKM